MLQTGVAVSADNKL